LEWSEFAVRLGRELAGLDRDTILIVREHDESRHYVQAMREPDRLYAEAVSNNFLDGPLALTPADEEVLTEAGWRPPTPDWAPANWWTELPPFAEAPDFAGLADMMVTALRDVQGLRRPADLVYESFHRHGTGLIELVDFGLAPADPSRITESRRTGRPAEPVYEPSGAGLGEAAGRGRPVGDGVALSAPSLPERPEPRPPDLDGLTPPAPPAPAAEPAGPDGAGLEARLAEAKSRGDHLTCFELLLSTDLVLMIGAGTGDGAEAGFATTTIGTGTYLMAFTSREAMAEALGDDAGGFREAGFGELAAAWPDPAWSLVVNAGLASEIHLDSATVARLEGMRRTAAQAATVDAVLEVPSTPRPAVRVAHGARLWRYDGESAAPVAVYDAVRAQWTLTGTAPQGE
jgi:hypothetical protein